MANSQISRPESRRGVTTGRTLTPEATIGLQQARNRERQRVFELAPSALEQYLRSRNHFEDEEGLAQTEGVSGEGGDGAEDCDWDDVDPDDPHPLSEEEDWYLPSACLEEPVAGIGVALVDRRDIYPLYVVPRGDQPWQVRFRAPSWIREVPKGNSAMLDKLQGFLHELSAWLEAEKQAFLREPSAHAFAMNEPMTDTSRVVKQNGLRDRVSAFSNARVAGEYPNDKRKPLITTQDMSRLLQGDKVWILWPETCVPLSALFSSEFTLAWGVARCLELAPAK
jgi:hypothetical protein